MKTSKPDFHKFVDAAGNTVYLPKDLAITEAITVNEGKQVSVTFVSGKKFTVANETEVLKSLGLE